MSTIVDYTANQCDEDNSKVLQSLLLLARRFLNQSDSGLRRSNAWDADQSMQAIPPRVWRRHSALLSMLVQQKDSFESSHNDAK